MSCQYLNSITYIDSSGWVWFIDSNSGTVQEIVINYTDYASFDCTVDSLIYPYEPRSPIYDDSSERWIVRPDILIARSVCYGSFFTTALVLSSPASYCVANYISDFTILPSNFDPPSLSSIPPFHEEL